MKRRGQGVQSVAPIQAAKVAKLQNGLEHSQNKSTSYKDSRYCPPTAEEISALKETEDLFKSSLFRLQISELLSEVQPKKKTKSLEEFLHSLNKQLMAMPDGTEHCINDLTWFSKKLKFPLPTTPAPVKGKFCFLKPATVKVVGSYLLGTATKPDLNVDIAVQMPKECFQPKDFMNQRYHHKRALYLMAIASRFRKSELVQSIKFSHMNGDILKPILVLKPKGKAGRQFCVRLYPCLSEGTFKTQRFSPEKNNIRRHWFRGQESNDETSATGPSTPHYNSSILSDMLFETHLHHLYKCVSDCPGMKDAVVLLKVWLHQRGMEKGPGTFSGFLCSMLISHLLKERLVNNHMSSYQILRVVLRFISTSDWTVRGISMAHDQDSVDNLPSLQDFHDVFEVVFVDPSGYFNLCANVTASHYKWLRHEARLSLEHLDSSYLDSFDVLFMKPTTFIQKCDQFFHIPDVSVLKPVAAKSDLEKHMLDRAGDWLTVASDWLMRLVTRGLGMRVELACLKPTKDVEWSVTSCPPERHAGSLTVGLLLNTEHAQNVLETGPPADDPEAKRFRGFWGEKSELRRFQDGTILEAVLWPCNNTAEKRVICERIIKHLLQRHGDIDPTCIHYIVNQLDCLLQDSRPQTSAKPKDTSSETGEETTAQVVQLYDSLCKQIRALSLPLSVHSLQGISSIFRGAEVLPPKPCTGSAKSTKGNHENIRPRKSATSVLLPSEGKRTEWCPAMEVILQFETSGKWPDDVTGIQHVKAAFHIRLAELLTKKCSLPAVATPKYVDVLKDGFVFRVKILHYREMVLLQQSKESEHKEMAQEIEREIVQLPQLTSTLHGVQQQYSSFSGTVRLAKRWVSSHMLSNHVTEECIELLAAHLFLSPAPLTPPGSPLCGFLRFLHLLSSTDWHGTALILNFNNDISVSDVQEINSSFTRNRSQLPAIFIATPKDKFTSTWTRNGPSKQILRRLVLLSRESSKVLESQLQPNQDQHVDFKQVFRPPLQDYDVIIKLNSRHIARRYQAVDAPFPASEHPRRARQTGALPVVNFDPVQLYLKELEEAFSEIALFFCDAHGADVIGVVWKPQAFVPSPFKVLHAQYKIPVACPPKTTKSKQPEQLMLPNITAVLSDLQALGEGLVKRVEGTANLFNASTRLSNRSEHKEKLATLFKTSCHYIFLL